jgi:hypothetical protein
MHDIETSSWRERRLLRSADRAASRPRSDTLLWYAYLAAIVAWFGWSWFAGPGGFLGGMELIELLWALAFLVAVLELDTALRLLGRLRRAQPLAANASPPSPAVEAPRGPTRLAPAEVRRLAGASAYAEHLERLRWLLPLLAAGALVSTLAALAWVELPRPLDLVVAGLAGVSIAATISVARLHGWVRLVAVLSQRGA